MGQTTINGLSVRSALLRCGIDGIGITKDIEARSWLALVADNNAHTDLLIRASVQEKMTPMLAKCAEHGNALLEPASRISALCRIVNDVQLSAVIPVIVDLINKNTKVMLLKGADFAISVYPENLSRFMLDIDILVRPPDLKTAIDVFANHGFLQGQVDTPNLLVQSVSDWQKERLIAEHYEIAMFVKFCRVPELDEFAGDICHYLPKEYFCIVDGKAYVRIEADVHFNFAIGVKAKDLWNNCRVLPLAGTSLFAMSAECVMSLVVARLYTEAMVTKTASIRQFVDILCAARVFESAVDWERVLDLGWTYSCLPALFYGFTHINRIIGRAVVPAEVIEECDRLRWRTRDRLDWGDFFEQFIESCDSYS